MDDPFRLRGLGSAPFDDEGVAVERRLLVDDGVVTTWLLNCSAARQLGLISTGHATRGLAGPPGVAPHNLHVTPGETDQAGLMRDAGAGLLITSMLCSCHSQHRRLVGRGLGFWFEDGEIAYPVSEITVAGNLLDIFGRLVPGSDLEFRGSTNAPSLMVDALAIGGR